MIKGLVFPPLPAKPSGWLARSYLSFVLGHVQEHAEHWPHGRVSREAMKWRIRTELAQPQTRAIVAVAEVSPKAIAGCAIVRPGTIVYVYVKEAPLRRRGIARAMLTALGVRPEVPHGVVVWTRDATEIARAGHWRIFPDWSLPLEQT